MKLILNLVILIFLMGSRVAEAQPLFQTGSPFIQTLCISPDERTMAVEGESGEVALWDIGARKKTTTLKRRATIRNTDEENPMTAFMPFVFSAIGRSFFTPNGKHLIVCNDKGVAAWDISKPLPVIDFFAGRDFYDVSKDGAFIVVVKAATANEDDNAASTGRGYSGDEIVVYDLTAGSKKKLKYPPLPK
ncbi:MAG: WD40 repeat domain-containing protein [Saprospiraceae bacterium]|nr:WD40 repeat domain-containing protein [Saprospiraceae bacterium]